MFIYEDIPLVPRMNETRLNEKIVDISMMIGRIEGNRIEGKTRVNTREDELLELHCNGKLWALGELVVHDNREAEVIIRELI